MVVIRLSRHGAKKRPFYHIVAADKRRARNGRYIERLGYFNPMAVGSDIRLEMNKTRVEHWVNLGAQPSDRVAKLLKDFEKGLTGPKQGDNPKKQKKKVRKAEETKAKAATETKVSKAEEVATEKAAEESN